MHRRELQCGCEMEDEMYLKDAAEVPHMLAVWVNGPCMCVALSLAPL